MKKEPAPDGFQAPGHSGATISFALRFIPAAIERRKINCGAGKKDSLHALPLVLDNIKVLNVDIIHRVFTGITTHPRFHQTGVHVVINRHDRRVFI